MVFNKVKLNSEVTKKLSLLKGRLDVTPNIICRYALCLSLDSPNKIIDIKSDSEGQEINRYTLNGEYDSLFVALTKFYCIKNGFDPEKDLNRIYKLHIERGVNLIYNRLKDLSDIENIF
jgi:DNA sulfur modification protein DndE